MITITDKAAEAVRKLQLEQSKPDLAIRLGVMGGGCSGFTYKIDIAETRSEKDRVFEKNGIQFLVEPKSYLFLHGIELDYEDTLAFKGFRFRNPNAKSTCGCGTSFTV